MMSFSQSIVTCFKKYLTISGRATRAVYWWFHLFVYLIAAFISWLAIISEEDGIFAVLGVFVVAVFCPLLCVLIRRLHDTGRPGEYIFLNLIPYIGGLIIFIFTLLGSDNDNVYGPKPLDNGECPSPRVTTSTEDKEDKVVDVADVEL